MTRRAIDRHLDRALRRARGRRPLAVVLGSTVNGLSFARSLGRAGVPVLVLDTGLSYAARSRYATAIELPPVEERPDLWLDLLMGLGAQLDAPGVLLPTLDPHMLFVSSRAADLSQRFRFLVADAETVERIVDKRRQYETAASAGVAIPATAYPASVEQAVAAAADRISYPCLIKPYRSHLGQRAFDRKLAVASNPDELAAAYTSYCERGIQVMVQEIIPGDDSELFCYEGLWDEGGEERAWITVQKLRQYPPGFGSGSLMMSVDSAPTAELSRDLLRAFRYRGLASIEFKRDPRNGRLVLMEINARSFAGTQLAVSAGVDLPMLLYRRLTGDEEAAAGGSFRRGVRFVHEEWDLKAYLVHRRRGAMSFAEWWRSVRGAESRAIGARDDPWPLLWGIGGAARAALRVWRGGRRWRGSSEQTLTR